MEGTTRGLSRRLSPLWTIPLWGMYLERPWRCTIGQSIANKVFYEIADPRSKNCARRFARSELRNIRVWPWDNLYTLTGEYVRRCVHKSLGVDKRKPTRVSAYLPACLHFLYFWIFSVCLITYLSPFQFSLSVCNLGVCLLSAYLHACIWIFSV